MSEDLILNINEPEIPESWDFEESISKVNSIKYKWKDLNIDLITELRIAQNILSIPPEEAAIKHGTKVPRFTWTQYCMKIGSSRQVVNRWLAKWFPKIKKEKDIIELSNRVSKTKLSLKKGWYKLGNQYLYYGSNLDNEFMSKLPSCVFAFADPPYNARLAEWDENFKWEQDYLQDIVDIVAITPGGWNAYNFYRETNMNYIWEMCCWIKNGMTHGKCGFANFIKISIFSKGSIKIPQDFFSITIKTNTTGDTKHKGRKPYEFMQHLIDMFSNESDNIIDCFAGSGTTLLMSEKMKRVSYNAEIKEDFCKEIIGRAISEGMQYERL